MSLFSSPNASRHDDPEICIRCGEAFGLDENGYCGHCHWAVRTEIEEGLYQLSERLRKEVSFQEWLARHSEAA
jgi:hypothetical protein